MKNAFVNTADLCKLFDVKAPDTANKMMARLKIEPAYSMKQGLGFVNIYDRARVEALTPEQIDSVRFRSFGADLGPRVKITKQKLLEIEDRLTLLEMAIKRLEYSESTKCGGSNERERVSPAKEPIG